MRTEIEQIRDLGYEVEIASKGEGWTAWSVNGHGVSVTITESDDEAWMSLVNLDAHNERVKQVESLTATEED